MKILFVDDMFTRHESFNLQFETFYPNNDFDILKVSKGSIALQFVKERQFDIMFLDHDLAEIHYLENLEDNQFVESNEISGTELAKAVSELPLDMRPKLVIIHSWNAAGVERMAHMLAQVGIKVVIYRFNVDLIRYTVKHIDKVIKEVSGNI